MSEETTNEAVEQAETHVETEAVETEATDWKAEARKWEKRAKANSEAAEKLAAIEEAGKTELQRMTERAEKAESALKAYEVERERAAQVEQVAKDTGVPAVFLEGYGGDDVAAYAESIKGYFAKTTAPVLPNDGRHADTGMTRESILAIQDPVKRKAAIAQHIDLF